MTRVKELTETRKKNIKTEAERTDKRHEQTIPRAVLQLVKKKHRKIQHLTPNQKNKCKNKMLFLFVQ